MLCPSRWDEGLWRKGSDAVIPPTVGKARLVIRVLRSKSSTSGTLSRITTCLERKGLRHKTAAHKCQMSTGFCFATGSTASLLSCTDCSGGCSSNSLGVRLHKLCQSYG